MAGQTSPRRKRRTRQHVIADLSVHHVEGFILECGHTCQRIQSDYGHDLMMTTFDEHGFIESGVVFFQLNAMESLEAVGPDFVYDLDIRDYNLWVNDRTPIVLVLFDAASRRSYWVAVRQYFEADLDRRPKKGARSVRVRVPKRQVMNQTAISRIRGLKALPIVRVLGR